MFAGYVHSGDRIADAQAGASNTLILHGLAVVYPTPTQDRATIRRLRPDVARILTRKCWHNPYKPYAHPTVRRIPAGKLRPIRATWQHRRAWALEAVSICGNQRAIIRSVFGDRAGKAIRVARCESRLSPRAVGAALERGLFQIHPQHRRWLGKLWTRLFDPVVNAEVAYRMSRRGTDWRPWTCARRLGIA